ncbi:hypothetical protein GQ53DRAFT_751636 [Thozetella sp. PMI_491]|nr:hypothetical protein GQ53DRAFT_751636 [Thozetella sp. PMI_491]
MPSSHPRLCAQFRTLALSSLSRPRQTQVQSTQAALRAFSTTVPTLYKQLNVPNSEIPIPSSNSASPDIPPYPYGPRQVYKQSNSGLYGSARIRFGNNVSEKWEVKTRRKWRPNVHSRRLWSESLGIRVRTRVTTRVLRTIDKVGGLDEYLLGGKTQRIKDLGPWGWRLRWRIMQTPAVQARFAREREELGLPPKPQDEVVLAEIQAMFPKAGSAAEIAAETQALLEGEGEFELGAEEELKEEGFMKEVSKKELGQ